MRSPAHGSARSLGRRRHTLHPTHTHSHKHTHGTTKRATTRAARREEDAEQEEAEQVVDAGGMRGSHDSPAPLHCFAPADSTRKVSTGRIGRAREVRVRSRAPHA